jgi:hypothetical protein
LQQAGARHRQILELVHEETPEQRPISAALQVAHRLSDHVVEVDIAALPQRLGVARQHRLEYLQERDSAPPSRGRFGRAADLGHIAT